MKYNDLRDFIAQLEKQGELKRISAEVDPHLEMTEICDRTLRAGGPALLFENPKGYDMPVLANLFGTPKRVAMGMGQQDVSALREIGKLLAFLKEPDPPRSEEHTSELQSRPHLVCRLLLEKKNTQHYGKELHEKYKIGRFRKFGDLDLDRIFELQFERTSYDVIDRLTNTHVTWNIWDKINLRSQLAAVHIDISLTDVKEYFFIDSPAPQLFTLSLHDALPI